MCVCACCVCVVCELFVCCVCVRVVCACVMCELFVCCVVCIILCAVYCVCVCCVYCYYINTPTSFLNACICCSFGFDTFNFLTATGPEHGINKTCITRYKTCITCNMLYSKITYHANSLYIQFQTILNQFSLQLPFQYRVSPKHQNYHDVLTNRQ